MKSKNQFQLNFNQNLQRRKFHRMHFVICADSTPQPLCYCVGRKLGICYHFSKQRLTELSIFVYRHILSITIFKKCMLDCAINCLCAYNAQIPLQLERFKNVMKATIFSQKLLISAFHSPLAEQLYLSFFVCPAMVTSHQISLQLAPHPQTHTFSESL